MGSQNLGVEDAESRVQAEGFHLLSYPDEGKHCLLVPAEEGEDPYPLWFEDVDMNGDGFVIYEDGEEIVDFGVENVPPDIRNRLEEMS